MIALPRQPHAVSNEVRDVSCGIFAFACLCVLGLAIFLGSGASSATAAEVCPNETSRTGPSAALPDCRVYEAVSPVATEGDAEAYVPSGGARFVDHNSGRGVYSIRPFEVASMGDAVIYPGDTPPAGGTGNARQDTGNAYLSTRSAAGGWNTVSIQPPGERPVYQAFSSDLSVGIILSEDPLAANAPPEKYGDLYTHSTAAGAGGEYHPFFTKTPAEIFVEPQFAGMNTGTSAVPASSHLLFETKESLLEGEAALGLEEAVEEALEEGLQPNVPYDSVAGNLSLVSVLPDGKADASASFGSFSTGPEGAVGFSHVISNDGSRTFWSDLEAVKNAEGEIVGRQPKALYVRENDSQPQSVISGGKCTEPARACTVQLDTAQTGASGPGGGGHYLTASADGFKVFFTDDASAGLTADTASGSGVNLYEYDFARPLGARLTDLTATAHADVRGLMGASEDGSYLYFVAGGALVAGVMPGSCETASVPAEIEEEKEGLIPPGKGCNVYLLHAGEPLRFIAALPARDNLEVVPFSGGQEFRSGDWSAGTARRTAEVTPDGRRLLFMSKTSLTGYDNKYQGDQGVEALDEVFLYSADTNAGELTCVSCDPGGEPPVETAIKTYLGKSVGAFFLITDGEGGNRFQPRVISDDGNRVFFDSAEPLVPEDTNGWLDVYEWERGGTGSCHQSQGCVYLLSGGTEPENSYFLGAGVSGDDVMFVTRSQLVAEDGNGNDDVYDARVNGVLAPTEPPPCEGEACRAALVSPSIARSPGSAGFSAPGNQRPRKHKGKHHRKKSHKHRKSHKRGADGDRRNSR